MNSTSNYGEDQLLFWITSTTTLSGIALLGNALIFFLVLHRAELRRNSNSFIILNLLLADLVCMVSLCTINTPAQIYKSDITCYAAGVVSYATAYCSWLNYLLLSLDRYMTLSHAELVERLLTRHRLYFLLGFTWALPFLILTSYLASATISFGFEEMQFCGLILDTQWKFIYDLVVLDGCIVGISYWGSAYCIFRIVQELQKRRAPFGLTHRIVERIKSELWLLILYGFLPIFLQIPFVIAKATGLMPVYPWMARVLVVLYLLDYTLTPFLVLFSHRAYMNALHAILLRRVGPGELGAGIKSSTSKHVLLEYFVDPKEIVR